MKDLLGYSYYLLYLWDKKIPSRYGTLIAFTFFMYMTIVDIFLLLVRLFEDRLFYEPSKGLMMLVFASIGSINYHVFCRKERFNNLVERFSKIDAKKRIHHDYYLQAYVVLVVFVWIILSFTNWIPKL